MTTTVFPPRLLLPQRTWKRAALLFGVALAAACDSGPSQPVTGSLVVTINGLPAGAANAVSVNGPVGGSGTSRVLSTTDTLESLAPGVYLVTAYQVATETGTYAPVTTSQQVEVAASTSRASVTVAFEIRTGSMALEVTGLPSGLPAAINISGTGGYYRQVTTTVTLASLQPGAYLISSNSVTEGSGHIYSPTPIAQAITVVASEAPRTVKSRYALATGALNVVVSGLPAQQAAAVTVSGPGGFSRILTGSETMVGLFPGAYSIQAKNVTGTPSYSPTIPTQAVTVEPSLTPALVEVTYAELNQPPPPTFNLSIAGLYVTQAIQSFSGDVPLVANMPGLVRVFLTATTPNTVGTTVRLRAYHGTALQQTLTLLPNVPGVPTTITEGTLGSSWNAILPAGLIQPGLRLVADVDPSNTVSESNETDNTFPGTGTFEPHVVIPPPLNITIVPVMQSATGVTADVTAANINDYLSFTRKVMPIRDYNVTLHDVFTSSAPALESNDGNGGWFQVLGEINALRVAEGSNDYYLGAVGTTYSSGVVGLAFVPGRAAIAWDRMPSGARVAAHELGHSFGRRHAPCGGVASPDPFFPHPLGTIGVYGYDVQTGILSPPGTSDLMGYCGFGWISDYNYSAILDYRAASGAVVAAGTIAARSAAARTGQSLVVWGRIVDGQPVLEPAFTAETRPALPAQTGPYRVEGQTADGRTVFSYAFEGEEPADMTGRNLRHFAFAIPISDLDAGQISRIALTTATGARSQLAVSTETGGDVLEATVESPNTIRFRVADASTRMAVVRDRTTRRILAFVRGQGPSVTVRSRATDFDVQFTDGVHSRSKTVRAIKR